MLGGAACAVRAGAKPSAGGPGAWVPGNTRGQALSRFWSRAVQLSGVCLVGARAVRGAGGYGCLMRWVRAGGGAHGGTVFHTGVLYRVRCRRPGSCEASARERLGQDGHSFAGNTVADGPGRACRRGLSELHRRLAPQGDQHVWVISAGMLEQPIGAAGMQCARESFEREGGIGGRASALGPRQAPRLRGPLQGMQARCKATSNRAAAT